MGVTRGVVVSGGRGYNENGCDYNDGTMVSRVSLIRVKGGREGCTLRQMFCYVT